MSGYDAAHALTTEYNSSQKEKYTSGYRRDYNIENLQKFNYQTASAGKMSDMNPMDSLSPQKSHSKRPLRERVNSPDGQANMSGQQDLIMNYYNSKKTFKKPPMGQVTQPQMAQTQMVQPRPQMVQPRPQIQNQFQVQNQNQLHVQTTPQYQKPNPHMNIQQTFSPSNQRYQRDYRVFTYFIP